MRTREIVVNGIICKTAPEAVAITGGKPWELKYFMRKGFHTYNGFNVEYLRHEAPVESVPSGYPKIDKFIREHKLVKEQPRVNRWAILSRRHVIHHLGVYR